MRQQGNLYCAVVSNNDGTADSITTLTREFDAHGNLLRQVIASGGNGDGAVDWVSTTTFTSQNV